MKSKIIRSSSYMSLLWMLCFLAGHVSSIAQPLWNTRRAIGDQIVVQDIKQKNKYYYAPKTLEMKTEADGRPVFQLLSMRYTGTQLTGDKAEKRFTNLLQFSVRQPALSMENLKEVAATFQLPANAQLIPMPIRNMEAIIVSGVGDGMSENKLYKKAQVQSESNDGKGVVWSERSFVMPLDNHEAQILWDQYKNGRLAVSLNYAFYADVLRINDEELKINGDSAFVETMKNAAGELERDTVESLEAVASNVLDIAIDLNQWPNALKQIDINENSIPPAYPSLEVKCFDFSYDIRPDLSYKRIFVEGTSVNGQPVQEKIKFSRGARDITTQYLAFRYALLMTKPLRYKIIEGSIDGEETEGPWVQMPQFSNLIDASTQQKKDQMYRHCTDVEVLAEAFNNDNLQKISVRFLFTLNKKNYSQRLEFVKGEKALLKNMCITHDLDKPVKYFILREFSSGSVSKGLVMGLPGDGYVLISK